VKAIVNVYLKSGILDPQGKAVHHALNVMGFEDVQDVRIGKQVVLKLSAVTEEAAREEATAMAKKLLVNSVTEDFDIEIVA
jgi:phosphoribosylformylglycinamidine synthase